MERPGDLSPPDHKLTEDERAAIKTMTARLSGSFYDVLGVPPDCDVGTVRTAYYESLRIFHPDVYWDRDTGGLLDDITRINHTLVEAFEVLSDPLRRAGYDADLAYRLQQKVHDRSSDRPRAGRVSTSVRPPADTDPFDLHVAALPPLPSFPENPPRSPIPAAVWYDAYTATSDGGSPDVSRRLVPFAAESVAGRPGSRPPAPLQGPVIPAPLQRSITTSVTPLPPGPPIEREPEEVRRTIAAQRFASVTGRPGRRTLSEPPPPFRPPSQPPGRLPSEPPSPQDAETTRQVTREALQRLRLEHHVKERQARRDELDEAVARAAMAEDDQEVLNLLQSALMLSPDDVELRARVERAQEAVSAVSVERYIMLARSAEKMRRWEPAAGYWQRAAVGRTDDPQLLLNAADALLHGNVDFGRAADLARRASVLDPNDAAPHLMLTRIFLASGRGASARGALEAAKRLAPDAPDVIALARRIRL